jgi:hypothetical protein
MLLDGEIALVREATLTYGEIKGFTLYATRTISSGGGEELLELARTNLRELDIELKGQ